MCSVILIKNGKSEKWFSVFPAICFYLFVLVYFEKYLYIVSGINVQEVRSSLRKGNILYNLNDFTFWEISAVFGNDKNWQEQLTGVTYVITKVNTQNKFNANLWNKNNNSVPQVFHELL